MMYFVFWSVLCHVYVTMNSYLSVRVHVGVVAQELLQVVAERMDVSVGELVLVAVTYPGGKYESLNKIKKRNSYPTNIETSFYLNSVQQYKPELNMSSILMSHVLHCPPRLLWQHHVAAQTGMCQSATENADLKRNLPSSTHLQTLPVRIDF